MYVHTVCKHIDTSQKNTWGLKNAKSKKFMNAILCIKFNTVRMYTYLRICFLLNLRLFQMVFGCAHQFWQCCEGMGWGRKSKGNGIEVKRE